MRVFVQLLPLFVVAMACNSTDFKSATPKQPNPAKEDVPQTKPPVSKTFKLACEKTGGGEAHLVEQVSGDARTQVRIEGEFCGISEVEAKGNLTVLFVVDLSGSMQANDPTVLGSCGRLKAAEALVDKLKTSVKPGLRIDVGLLPFGDYAKTGVEPKTLAEFEAELTEDAFCDTTGGATNYEAAFVGAKAMLDGRDGAKAVYLISDGLPTNAGTTPGSLPVDPLAPLDEQLAQVEKAGLDAAEALRKGDKDLTLNAIFLGAADPGATGLPGAVGTDPEEYLKKITGDAERVRLVKNADDLAQEIVTLETPDVASVDKDSASGDVKAAQLGEKKLALASLEKDPNREGVWTFVTEPFELYGKAGAPISNEITITVKSTDGKVHKATAQLDFALEQ
jgi:Mg-chelatase subunit ChlD